MRTMRCVRDAGAGALADVRAVGSMERSVSPSGAAYQSEIHLAVCNSEGGSDGTSSTTA